jgi:23S rRNA (pseudouridine1915-N3)-methyltransferase
MKMFYLSQIMLSIRILAVGGMKDIHTRGLCEEYLKRLKPYAKVEVVEVLHEPFRDLGEKARVQALEAERITKQLRGKSGVTGSVLFLEERGKQFDSISFAQMLGKLSERGELITFVLGGALGLGSELTRGQTGLSLSALTLPHELARVVLCEQLYRAATLLQQKRYHY